MAKTWKESKINYMKFLYGEKVPKYTKEMEEAKFRDDRQVYINTYNYIMEMLETLPDEPHLYVRVAINDKMAEDIKMLQEINLHFIGEKF